MEFFEKHGIDFVFGALNFDELCIEPEEGNFDSIETHEHHFAQKQKNIRK